MEAIATLLLVTAFSLADPEPDEEPTAGNLIQTEQPVYRRFKTNVAMRHDRGGLFRVELGAVGVSAARFESAGFTAAGQIAIGGLPWRRVGLHLSAFGWGTDQKGVLGAGPGVTFWFREEGPVFVSAALGPIWMAEEGHSNQWQFGGELQLGYYRWVGDRWSMGASLVVGGETFDLDGDGESWSRARGGLRVGVLFN